MPAPSSRLTDDDVYLFNEGRHLRLYDVLGAHLEEREGVAGCHFAVWAPNAQAVSLICDRNGWQPGVDRLQPRSHRDQPSGLWEAFIPGLWGNTCEGSTPSFRTKLEPGWESQPGSLYFWACLGQAVAAIFSAQSRPAAGGKFV